ncbi:MAG: DUF523 domain-containing protein [Deltaproteobacteria bacterium]|nr:MAG: DUF523 domain-containing protein [Deltaproteobacteria bacterium]
MVTRQPPVIVSACLLGRRCRYDGGHRDSPIVRAVLRGREVLPVCPEELGGLGTPRPAAELRGGDGAAVLHAAGSVVTQAGADCTEAFLAGAQAALGLAREAGAGEAILKDRSPSCGVSRVHQDGDVRSGVGVFAALLKANEFVVRADTELGDGEVREMRPRPLGGQPSRRP